MLDLMLCGVNYLYTLRNACYGSTSDTPSRFDQRITIGKLQADSIETRLFGPAHRFVRLSEGLSAFGPIVSDLIDPR